MKVFQINTIVNSGSTGRIMEEIGSLLLSEGHESFIAYGLGSRDSKSQLFKVGSKTDMYRHGAKTAIFDRHGFGSRRPTEELIQKIKQVNPDVIGLHNLHGYYLNIEVLFTFLEKCKIPVIWTLHDCWAFTGHCTYFDSVGCEKWKTHCSKCPKTKFYPASYLFDNSERNFCDKKRLFNLPSNLHIVTPSDWLMELVKMSFLSHPVQTIHNGVDLAVFNLSGYEEVIEKYELFGRKIILGVASNWDVRKGLNDFIQLNSMLSPNEVIILVGLNQQQIKSLPDGMIGIKRTENVMELSALYATADVFVNPTWQDNFPTTNIEALACGTPVITYRTGGSPEAIDQYTGFVLEKGDIKGIYESIQTVLERGKSFYSSICRKRAIQNFNKDDKYQEYINLYAQVLK